MTVSASFMTKPGCRAPAMAVAAVSTHAFMGFVQPAAAEDRATVAELVEAMRDRVVPHLAAAPEAGVNTILVGHDDPFDAATGIYPEPMGVTFVIRPGGGGSFEILASIAPDAWPTAIN